MALREAEVNRLIDEHRRALMSLDSVTERLSKLDSLFAATSECNDLTLGNSTSPQPDPLPLVATAKEIRKIVGIPETLLSKLCDERYVRRRKMGKSRQSSKLHMVGDVVAAVRALLSGKRPERKSGKKKR